MGTCLGKSEYHSGNIHDDIGTAGAGDGSSPTNINVTHRNHWTPSTSSYNCCCACCSSQASSLNHTRNSICSSSCFRWGKTRGNGLIDPLNNSSGTGGGNNNNRNRRRRTTTNGSSGRGALMSNQSTERNSSGAIDPNLLISVTPQIVNDLVLQTLVILRTLVGNDQEAPVSMVKLHNIAEHEDGWLLVVTSLVNAIPMDDPLGPAVISLLLDDCPLPTKENATQLSRHLDLLNENKYTVMQKRNICLLLGCLAEKLAGQNSKVLLNDEVMKFLLSQLNVRNNPYVILYAVIALEKFAQTSENKTAIMKAFEAEPIHPLVTLEKWNDAFLSDRRQVGFCAQWCLDNIFLIPGRKFGYELVDNSGINVILNSYDVSENLKISPNGLEARCDASSFESVRSTFQVDSGVWFYETLIVTEGVMQIGWATKASKFLNHEGYGIGDDEFSVAYDGCRQVMWHNAQSEPMTMRCWKPGDILGTYLDLEKQEINFYLNGELIKTHTAVFIHTKTGFFAAASFMSFQQCLFNFGHNPFKYPPYGKRFNNFNQYATLGDECRVVLPRHLKMEYLRKVSVKENSCNLCYDHIANVRLLPCEHCGFCSNCADQLEVCSLCRQAIENKIITTFET